MLKKLLTAVSERPELKPIVKSMREAGELYCRICEAKYDDDFDRADGEGDLVLSTPCRWLLDARGGVRSGGSDLPAALGGAHSDGGPAGGFFRRLGSRRFQLNEPGDYSLGHYATFAMVSKVVGRANGLSQPKILHVRSSTGVRHRILLKVGARGHVRHLPLSPRTCDRTTSVSCCSRCPTC